MQTLMCVHHEFSYRLGLTVTGPWVTCCFSCSWLSPQEKNAMPFQGGFLASLSSKGQREGNAKPACPSCSQWPEPTRGPSGSCQQPGVHTRVLTYTPWSATLPKYLEAMSTAHRLGRGHPGVGGAKAKVPQREPDSWAERESRRALALQMPGSGPWGPRQRRSSMGLCTAPLLSVGRKVLKVSRGGGQNAHKVSGLGEGLSSPLETV